MMGNWLLENILIIIIVTIIATITAPVVGKIENPTLKLVLIALLVLIDYILYIYESRLKGD